MDASARTSDRRDGGHSGLAPGTEGCELSWWAPRRARGTGSEVVDSSTLRFLTASALEAKRKEEVAREEKKFWCVFLWNALLRGTAGSACRRNSFLSAGEKEEEEEERILFLTSVYGALGRFPWIPSRDGGHWIVGSTLVPFRCLRVACGVQEMFYVLEMISGTCFYSAPLSRSGYTLTRLCTELFFFTDFCKRFTT